MRSSSFSDVSFSRVRSTIMGNAKGVGNLIEKAMEILPARQREAFILRYWEEMSLAETAVIMNCSEGSVKTHCSRAVHTLASILREKGVKL